MIKLRMGGVPEYFNLPILLAKEEGKFAACGIDLEWTDIPEGTGKMVQCLADGRQDLVIALTEGLTKAIALGNPSKIIHTYVQSPLIWGIHTSIHSKASSIEDLKGECFAISRYGSGSHLMAILLAKDLGWEISDLKFEIVNNLDGARKALKEGVAQIFLWEKYTTKFLVEQAEFKRLSEYPTPWPCFVIGASNQMIDQNSKALKTALEVIIQAASDFSVHPGAASMIMKRYNVNPVDSQAFLSHIHWSKSIYLPEKETQEVLKTFHNLGHLDSFEKTVTHALPV